MPSSVKRIADPCDVCHLDGDCLKSKGYKKSTVLVVTKSPSQRSLYQGKHLADRPMGLFAKSVQAEGFQRSDFAFHAAVMCEYDAQTIPRKVRTEITNTCKEYYRRVVQRMRPKIIVPLGGEACRTVFGREVAITKERGIPRRIAIDLGEDEPEHECIVMPMLDPSFCLDYPQHQSSFSADCRALRQVVDYDYDLEAIQDDRLGDYQEVDDLEFLIDMNPGIMAFDVETLGLDPFADRAKLMTLQFCVEKGRAYILTWDHPDNPKSKRQKRKLIEQLHRLFRLPRLKPVGHNLKFDALWMWVLLGVEIEIYDDTLMMAAVVDENMQNKTLANCIKRWVPSLAGYSDLFDRDVDKNQMDEVPLPRVISYGGGDADGAFRLARVLRREVKKDARQYASYRKVSIPGLNAFYKMESRGVSVSPKALTQLKLMLRNHVEVEEGKVLQQIHPAVKKAHVEKGLKLSRDAFLRDILFWHPKGLRLKPRVFTKTTQKLSPELQVPSVSTKDHLPFFFEDYPLVRDLSELIKTKRLLNTNVEKFQEKYVNKGRVHCKFSLSTAVTGRSSSSDPNMQNIPQRGEFAKAYKRVFIAPRGYAIVAADLSQAELRIAADMASERTMLRVYNEHGDIHAMTAASVMGITLAEFNKLPDDVKSLQRFRAKAVNFGFLYGMWWRKFQHYAKTQYSLDYTDRESESTRVKFFETYPGLERWHIQTKAFARERGFVRSYCGRIRHLPMIYSREDHIRQEAERQAVNAPVQAFASQLGIRAMAEVSQDTDPSDLKMISFVHDCLYALVPIKYTEWAAKRIKSYMEGIDLEKLFGIKFKVPLIADVSFGFNMGDVQEMESLRLDEPYDFSVHKKVGSDMGKQRIPGRSRQIVGGTRRVRIRENSRTKYASAR